MKRPGVVFLLFFVAAALPRLLFLFAVQGYPGAGYGEEMERAAANIVREGTIGNVYSATSGVSAHVAPLYPYVLAALYWVFGLQDFYGWAAQAIAAVAASSAAIALLPALAKRLGLAPLSGYLAAGLAALLPVHLWVETSGSWEQPYTALALVALLFCFGRLHEQHWESGWLVVGTGVLCGAAVLLSPIMLPVIAVMILGEFMVAAGRRIALVVPVSGLILVVMSCTAPWMYRNYSALGGFVAIRSNFGLELWIGNNPQSNGKTFVTYWDDPGRITRRWHPGGSRSERARLQEIGELSYMREKQREAWQWIAGHPGRFLALTADRFRYHWFPGPDMWSPTAPAVGFKALVYCAASIGCFAGLLILFVQRYPCRWLMLAAAFVPCLSYLVTHVDARYRYPTFGLSILLGCHALAWLLPLVASRCRRVWSLRQTGGVY
jgi:hypothetical protein